MFSALADCVPDLQRWTVDVADENQPAVLTVIFPAHSLACQRKSVLAGGARALLQRLHEMMARGAMRGNYRVQYAPAEAQGNQRRPWLLSRAGAVKLSGATEPSAFMMHHEDIQGAS